MLEGPQEKQGTVACASGLSMTRLTRPPTFVILDKHPKRRFWKAYPTTTSLRRDSTKHHHSFDAIAIGIGI